MTVLSKPLVPLVLTAAMVFTACGSDGDGATPVSGDLDSTSTTVVASTEPEPGDPDPTDEDGSSTPSTTTVDTDGSTTPTGVEGEPIDVGPMEGDTLAVVGVAHDDVLNVRATPGVDGEVTTTLAPLADDLSALGNTRDLSPGFWVELDEGWVNLAFVGYLGTVTDETAAVVENLGERPIRETMVELGLVVAETFASDEPASEIVQVTAPAIGDLGEITFDVIGIGDDAQIGWRVHVFGTEDASGEAFGLRSVEVTALCGRGVSTELLCN